MNCDQAFERLTRDAACVDLPDDPQLDAHLAECAGCRRLAAAILPAVELLREPAPAASMAPVAGPWNLEPSPVPSPSGGAARRRGTPPDGPRWSLAPFLHLAAALLIGVALAGAIYGDKQADTTSPGGPQAAAPLTPAALWGTLSESCRAEPAHRAGSSTALVCCTECHAAGQRQVKPPADLTQLLLSCQVCHAN